MDTTSTAVALDGDPEHPRVEGYTAYARRMYDAEGFHAPEVVVMALIDADGDGGGAHERVEMFAASLVPGDERAMPKGDDPQLLLEQAGWRVLGAWTSVGAVEAATVEPVEPVLGGVTLTLPAVGGSWTEDVEDAAAEARRAADEMIFAHAKS